MSENIDEVESFLSPLGTGMLVLANGCAYPRNRVVKMTSSFSLEETHFLEFPTREVTDIAHVYRTELKIMTNIHLSDGTDFSVDSLSEPMVLVNEVHPLVRDNFVPVPEIFKNSEKMIARLNEGLRTLNKYGQHCQMLERQLQTTPDYTPSASENVSILLNGTENSSTEELRAQIDALQEKFEQRATKLNRMFQKKSNVFFYETLEALQEGRARRLIETDEGPAYSEEEEEKFVPQIEAAIQDILNIEIPKAFRSVVIDEF